MKLSAKKILFFELLIVLYGNLIKDIIPQFNVIMFLPDVCNAIIIFFVIDSLIKKKITKPIKRVIILVLFLLAFDLLRGLISNTNTILLVWGLRNQYRFFIFFIACMIFLNSNDLKRIEKFFSGCFIINLFVASIEYVIGYKRDYCGGTFGIGHNCNSCVLVFLSIVCCYSIFMWLKRLLPIKKMIIALVGSLYWATLAEIKVFYIFILIIVFSAVMFSTASVNKKLKIIGYTLFGIVGAVILLSRIFPEQVEFILKYGIKGYATGISAGIHGFGRTTAISVSNNMLFNNSLVLKIFGVGTGNAEFIDIGLFKLYSHFYENYKDFGYASIFYAFMYIERGVIGLLIYAIIIIKSIILAARNLKKQIDVKFVAINYCAMNVAGLFFLICIYDASFRISSAGYLAFLGLSIPYWIIKKIK